MTPFLQTLRHFELFTYATLGSPVLQEIMESSILAMALQKPYLMHAILGVAACHLSHLVSATHQPTLHYQCVVADAYHWQKALPLLREEFNSPHSIGPHNMDALFGTCALLFIHSFQCTDADPRRRWGSSVLTLASLRNC